jgi:enoyl-[acyl-carrier protein] reductase III
MSSRLAAEGAIVFAGYFQNEEGAAEFRRMAADGGWTAVAVKANLMTAAGVQTLYDAVMREHGHLDALVYNSAIGVHKPLESLTQRHLATVWQLNVGAFFDLCQKFKPHMGNGARIIAISSEGARRAVDDYGAIGSSKSALESLCRQMAVEWGPNGIRVNIVSPGLLETDTLTAMPTAHERVAFEERVSPLGRLVRLDEVACAVQFLCSPGSDGITGHTLVVDGGKSASALVR